MEYGRLELRIFCVQETDQTDRSCWQPLILQRYLHLNHDKYWLLKPDRKFWIKKILTTQILDNTLVIFTSDNGPSLARHERGGCAGLFRSVVTLDGEHITDNGARVGELMLTLEPFRCLDAVKARLGRAGCVSRG